MAAYAISRQRTLRGMGATFSFVPRRRTLRGMGDSTDIDFATGLPCDDPRANCGPIAPDIGAPIFPFTSPLSPPSPTPPLPASWFTNPSPIIPAPKIVPVTPPDLGPIALPKIVFPSQGTVQAPPKYAAAAAPTASWMDQQMIAGIPNSYLALATVGLVLFVSISGAKRRR